MVDTYIGLTATVQYSTFAMQIQRLLRSLTHLLFAVTLLTPVRNIATAGMPMMNTGTQVALPRALKTS